MVHSKTRMNGVIENLATLGLSITYNRVSKIQEQVMKQEINDLIKWVWFVQKILSQMFSPQQP